MYITAKAWIEETGGISHCNAIKHRTKPQSCTSRETVHDDLIHILDLLLWLCGGDYELLHNNLQQGREGRLLQSSGMLGWKHGAIGMYSMVREAGIDLEKLEVHGKGRSVEVRDLDTAVLYEKDALPRTQSFGSWDTVLDRRGFSGVVDYFLKNINTPEVCSISASAVLPSHILAAQLSE